MAEVKYFKYTLYDGTFSSGTFIPNLEIGSAIAPVIFVTASELTDLIDNYPATNYYSLQDGCNYISNAFDIIGDVSLTMPLSNAVSSRVTTFFNTLHNYIPIEVLFHTVTYDSSHAYYGGSNGNVTYVNGLFRNANIFNYNSYYIGFWNDNISTSVNCRNLFFNYYAPYSGSYNYEINLICYCLEDNTCAYCNIRYNETNTYGYFGFTSRDIISSNQLQILNSIPLIELDSDTILDGGGTQSDGLEGGSGSFDYTGDTITEDSLPSISAIDTGFITLYNPSLSQLNSLASYMWSTTFTSAVNNTFASPMDAIIALNLIPVSPSVGSSSTVMVGNVSTGITMPVLTSQWVEFDCGSLSLPGKFDAYLDYSPHTLCEIYLPFIGYQKINANDITDKTVQIKYKVDCLSGACVALIIVDGSVLYQYQGNCATPLPLSGRDYGSILGALSGYGGAQLQEWGGTLSNTANTASQGGLMQMLGGMAAQIGGGFLNAIGSGALGSVAGSLSGSQSVQHGGSVGQTGGMLSQQTPFITLTVPKQKKPTDYGKYTGYPCYKVLSLGDVSGYTEIGNIWLKATDAKNSEKSEIVNILQNGIYIKGVVNERPTQSDSTMTVTTYINKSADNWIGKTIDEVNTYEGKLRDGCDEFNPVILIEQDGRNDLVNMNYCSISWFERFYFVTDVIVVREGLWELHCHCDVIETFASDILDCKAFITRSQSNGNLYVNDDRMIVQANPYVLQNSFPSGFSSNQFILAVSGA